MRKLIIAMSLLIVSMSGFAAGKDYYATNCASCHGAKAEGQGMFPKLAGKDVKSLVADLKKFKAKTRTLPFPVPVKESMTDKEIDEVSAYLSTVK